MSDFTSKSGLLYRYSKDDRQPLAFPNFTFVWAKIQTVRMPFGVQLVLSVASPQFSIPQIAALPMHPPYLSLKFRSVLIYLISTLPFVDNP